MMFVVKNREIFVSNKDHYKMNTRHIMDIHMTQVNLAKHGNGVHHMAVKIYNALPNTLKEISKDTVKFKVNLKTFLHFGTFYKLDEFFMR
jgi:hypothetical protein